MWSIAELKNEPKITKECAEDLLKIKDGPWYEDDDIDDVILNEKLYFNPDHMEHMDYLFEKKIQKVLKKHKIKGDVCFGSLDGDNAGSFWGYRFDGNGNMITLSGKIFWTED